MKIGAWGYRWVPVIPALPVPMTTDNQDWTVKERNLSGFCFTLVPPEERTRSGGRSTREARRGSLGPRELRDSWLRVQLSRFRPGLWMHWSRPAIRLSWSALTLAAGRHGKVGEFRRCSAYPIANSLPLSTVDPLVYRDPLIPILLVLWPCGEGNGQPLVLPHHINNSSHCCSTLRLPEPHSELGKYKYYWSHFTDEALPDAYRNWSDIPQAKQLIGTWNSSTLMIQLSFHYTIGLKPFPQSPPLQLPQDISSFIHSSFLKWLPHAGCSKY